MLDKRGVIILLILLALVIGGGVVFKIAVILNYGDKPVSEVPTWVVWVLND